ncbi:MAG: UDP-N-acetylmuramoyl-tripeptide--D-alanyl-D-alanine ligase [Anaerolineae bacterium]|nr:UDP-N-acetylmuramoyl-tripeptide--D-alanyl-D-alanine ligase [Anaerolineae bacterium]
MTQHLTLGTFVEALTDWHPDSLEMPVYPVIDSRIARSGAVFFALPGEHLDGHDYVEDALARGAAAAVVQRDVVLATEVAILDVSDEDHPALPAGRPLLIKVPDVLGAMQQAARWWRHRLGVRVIAVTGSVGKTTTKEVVAQVLSRHYEVSWSKSSFNNEIGLPLTLLELTSASERLVVELGMYVRGDIRFLADIAGPDVGIVTNVEPVHAERAGSIDEIALGKRELPESLPLAPDGVAILNYDDPRVRDMAAHTQARTLLYGLAPEADLWANEVKGLGLGGLRATLHYGDDAVTVTVPLLGRHSIYAVLRGAAVGLVEGLSWDEIVEGLQGLEDPLRLQIVQGVDGVLIIDDAYNSSPPSALAALDLLADLDGRKVAALGDMLELGDYERDGHTRVGSRAAEVVAELVVVGELAVMIGEGAVRGGLSSACVHAAADSEAAIDVVSSLLRPGDVILVKGSRGVKMEQIVDALKRGDPDDEAAER